MSTSDWSGTVGVGLILLAYFLNIFSLIPKDGKWYYLLNIVGSCIACFASVLIQFIPFIILEATWAVVSVIGLMKSIKKTPRLT